MHLWTRKLTSKYILLNAAIFAVILTAPQSLVSASGMTSLSFSPGTVEAGPGKDLVIKVHLNTAAVNAVQADIAYPLALFDPLKSKAICGKTFPTVAQRKVNAEVQIDGSNKGMILLACGVEANGDMPTNPFNGEADVATLILRVRESAPTIRDSKMLSYVVDNDLSDGRSNYSSVARASDSSNILASTGSADVTLGAGRNNNILDLSILLSNYGRTSDNWSDSKADLNNDGVVNLIDLSILLSP
jgi:hypothetical protein